MGIINMMAEKSAHTQAMQAIGTPYLQTAAGRHNLLHARTMSGICDKHATKLGSCFHVRSLRSSMRCHSNVTAKHASRQPVLTKDIEAIDRSVMIGRWLTLIRPVCTRQLQNVL